MDTTARPEPVAVKTRVIASTYDGREVAAWRMAMGVTQGEVATRLRMTQGRIAHLERDTMPERQARRIIQAVEYIARKRERMQAQGLAELQRIIAERAKAAGFVPPEVQR